MRYLLVLLLCLVGCQPTRVGPKTPACEVEKEDSLIIHSSGQVSIPVGSGITIGTDGSLHLEISDGFYYSPSDGEFSLGF